MVISDVIIGDEGNIEMESIIGSFGDMKLVLFFKELKILDILLKFVIIFIMEVCDDKFFFFFISLFIYFNDKDGDYD